VSRDALRRFRPGGRPEHRVAVGAQDRVHERAVLVGVIEDEDAGRAFHGYASTSGTRQYASTWAGNFSTSMGLAMTPTNPSSPKRARSACMTDAVRATIGMDAVAASAFSWRVASTPSMPGSAMSIRTRSG